MKRIIKTNNKVFGESFPHSLLAGISTFWKYLTDSAIRDYVIKNWTELDEHTKMELFITYQRSTFSNEYIKVIQGEEINTLGKSVSAHITERSSVRECNAAAAFIKLFCNKADKNILKSIYGKLKASKGGKKAVTELEGYSEVLVHLI